MAARSENDSAAKHDTSVERTTERELVVTRTVNGPARLVYEAWAKPELFKLWWVPKSFGLTLVSNEADVRVGGGYRLVFRHGDSPPMAFFGKYLEVVPNARLSWTNDEGEGPGPITTVTFEEKAGRTLQVMHELYPSKEALDACMASGEKSCVSETFEQLDTVLAGLGTK